MSPPATTPPSQARVVIVEDHAMVREMFVHVITGELGHLVVGEATTAAEGLAACLRCKPDLVILDWALPDGRGFELVKQAGPQLPRTRWICISANEQEHLVSEAVELGVHGFVLKRSDLDTFTTAVATVLRGESFYCPTSSKLLVEGLRSRSSNMGSNLTPRERDVLISLARGESAKETAERHGMQLKTVHNHLTSLREKLGVHEAAGLVRYAIKHGYVSEP